MLHGLLLSDRGAHADAQALVPGIVGRTIRSRAIATRLEPAASYGTWLKGGRRRKWRRASLVRQATGRDGSAAERRLPRPARPGWLHFPSYAKPARNSRVVSSASAASTDAPASRNACAAVARLAVRAKRSGVQPLASASGSLGLVFDHVAIAVSDLAASERFYRTVLSVLGVEPSYADAELVEWEDWDIMPTDREHPVTRGLHVGFRAPSRAAVDAFWQAGIDAGYRDDGAPGPRTQYGPDYYGGFLLDPDGNSAEAVHGDRARSVPDGRVDHLWLRVADLAASKRFYATIAPHAGIRLGDDEPGRVQFTGEDYSFSLIDDERPLTEHVHLAFPAREDATVRAFHAAALAAGYEDHGGPGERAVYHPGYYGAFVLDPDGHNVEVVNHNR